MLEIVAQTLYSIGLTLGVGSSTFALIFYIRALDDGLIDTSERKFMRIVYVVLRIGMVLLFISLLLISFFTSQPTPIPAWLLLSIILVNAILMQLKRMPMRIGPVLAGGSWYFLFVVSQPVFKETSVVILSLWYVLTIFALYGIFHYVKRYFAVSPLYKGDVSFDTSLLKEYATDASAFKLIPQAIYFPKNADDIVTLVEKCRNSQASNPRASLTVRAGGTCMSGGPLNTGWIIDMTRHMKSVVIDKEAQTATVEMGAYFRDIEDEAAKHGLMFAPYTSSHRLCGIGGMLGNNASGEKSIRHGATSDNVLTLDVVLADGTTAHVEPKNISSLTDERDIRIYDLHKKYGTKLKKATGDVPKSASGYRLEKIVSGNMFNLVPLFVGAQGTLGIITRATLKLTPIPAHTELLLISASSLKDIPFIIDTIYEHNPEGIETFDRNTFARAKEHLSESARLIEPYINPSFHLVILAQFSEHTKSATIEQAKACLDTLTQKGCSVVHLTDKKVVNAAWDVRRNSFLLMRDYNEKGHKAVPCIEDVIVPRKKLHTFITELRSILKRRCINYGYHGHIGDGSLRIIPVFDFTNPNVGEEITGLMTEVFTLVKKLKGNISADHSDGIIRSPFLKDFYGEELYEVFTTIKKLYDPHSIMNPRKKVEASLGLLNQCLDC